MNIRANLWKSWQILICFLLILYTPLLAEKPQNEKFDNNTSLLGLPGSLKGKVILQGRPQGKMAASLKVQLYEPGKLDPAFTYNVSSNADGEFTIDNIYTGDYVVTVKNSHTLQVAATASITQGTVTIIEFDPLPEGDANNDNQVTELDFSVLSKAFGTVEGGNGYNSAADFNVDTNVSVLDFSLLAENYNKKGYQVTENSYNELSSGSSIGFYLEEPDDNSLGVSLFRH